MSDELRYQVALTFLDDIGHITAKKLIAYCGGAEAVFTKSKKELLEVPGIGRQLVNKIQKTDALKQADDEIKFMEREGIGAISFLDEDYPPLLKLCHDGPLVLYRKGNFSFKSRKVVAFVGTRNATDYGKGITKQLIQGLVDFNPIIVSGLAYGIDISAHRAAMEFGLTTVAVTAMGLQTVYPAQHKNYATQMMDNGGLVTEFPSSKAAHRDLFPMRNRVIAGMAEATVVVESKRSGGSLITGNIAHGYGREVMAIPGKVGDTQSEGCNQLIKSLKASMIESPADIAKLLNWDLAETGESNQMALDLKSFTDKEKLVLKILDESPNIQIDLFSDKAEMKLNDLAATLLNLEFGGYVETLAGKRYRLTAGTKVFI